MGTSVEGKQMSNTPRTDAAAVDLGKVTVPINGEWVGAPFARQLERELIAYKGHLAAAETQLQEAWRQVAEAMDAPRSATAATDRPDWAQQLPGAEIFDRAAQSDHGYDRTASLNEGRYVCTCGACSRPDAQQPNPHHTTQEQPK